MILTEDSKRLMLPRWRSVRDTILAGELDAIAVPHHFGSEQLEKAAAREIASKERRWVENGEVEDAEELVAASIVAGRISDSAIAAAEKIANDPRSQQGSRSLALSLLQSHGTLPHSVPTQIRTEARIQLLKRIIRSSPRDSLRLAELSLLYTLLGQHKPAWAAMRRALSLTKSNRYVVRSAVRLLVHMGQPDHAASLVEHLPAVERDPWLMAAAITAREAASYDGKLIRTASRMVQSADFSSFDLSELRASLATQHLNAGENKLARKHFRQSLARPTENAIAQAKWAQGLDKAIEISPSLVNSLEAFEAQALDFARSGDWHRSISATGEWKDDERFSDRPFIHASWISTGPLNDPKAAVGWLQEGLVANPDDPGLLNNAAVAWAMLGDIDRAQEMLVKATRSADEDARSLTLTATAGLIAFRSRDFERGAALYQQALSVCVDRKLPHQWLRGAVYLARELSAVEAEYALRTLEQVSVVQGRLKDRGQVVGPEIDQVAGQVRSEIEKKRAVSKWNWGWEEIAKLGDNLLLN